MTAGSTINLPSGVAPPKPPPGLNWVQIRIIYGTDTGTGLVTWQLQEVEGASWIANTDALRDSFNQGLAEFVRFLGAAGTSGAATTGSVQLYAPSANTVSWPAPANIVILDVLSVAGSIQWALTVNPTLTYTQLTNGTVNFSRDCIAIASTNTSQSVSPCRFPVAAGQKVFLVNNSGSFAEVLVVFQLAKEATG